MSLILTTYNLPAWYGFANNLGLPTIEQPDFTQAALLHPVQTPQAVAQWLNQWPEQHFVLAIAQAEYYLAAAIDMGTSLDDAAAQWQQLTKETLHVYRQHRSQLQLVNLHQALAEPQAFANLLAPAVVAHNQAQAVAPTLALLAATQYLAQHAELQTLNNHLHASTQPLAANGHPQLDIDSILQHAQAQTDQLSAAHEEHKRLATQLHKLQQQHETEQAASAARVQLLTQQSEVQQQELNTQAQILNNAQQESQLILSQLLAVQEELEQYHLQEKQTQQQLQAAQQTLAQQRTTITQSEASSKQLAQKVQSLQQEISTQAQANSLAQEQLKQHSAALNTAQQTLAQVNSDKKQLIEKTTKLQQQLAEQTQATNSANTELEHTRIALKDTQKHLKNSQDEQASASEENQLILTQLLNVQEELERYYLKQQEQAQQLDKQARKIEWQKNERKKLENKLQTAEQQAEEKLQHATKQTTEQAQAIKQLEQQLNAANTQLSDYLASIALLNEERETFLAQIQHAEQRSNEYKKQIAKEQQAQKHANLAKEKQFSKEQNTLKKQLQSAKARTASAEYAGQLLQQELARIKNSKIWKSTAPARALQRLVRKTDADQEQLTQNIALLLTSEYFDIDWYVKRYPDVAENKVNPAEHYLRYGANEGRQPSQAFDGNWYLQQYPDVAKANMNPLLHFIKFGMQEGRRSSPKLLTQQGSSSNKANKTAGHNDE